MVNTSPNDRVVGPFPIGRTSWLINRADPNHVSKSWDEFQATRRVVIWISPLDFTSSFRFVGEAFAKNRDSLEIT